MGEFELLKLNLIKFMNKIYVVEIENFDLD